MIMKISLIIAAGILLSFILVETAVGCGEVTYRADRTWQSNQCVFLTTKMDRGKW
jgi:hypothetical protein